MKKITYYSKRFETLEQAEMAARELEHDHFINVTLETYIFEVSYYKVTGRFES